MEIDKRGKEGNAACLCKAARSGSLTCVPTGSERETWPSTVHLDHALKRQANHDQPALIRGNEAPDNAVADEMSLVSRFFEAKGPNVPGNT